MIYSSQEPPVGAERKARGQDRSQRFIDIERAKNEHIKSLEKDKRRLLERVDELQAMVDRLAPENARLEEAHSYAVANRILGTFLVAIGDCAISFATFAAAASKVVAYVGAAVLMSGVLVLIFSAFRNRATKPAQLSRVDRASRAS